MRILVTGASGRVGRLLVPLLVQEGHTVRAMQRGISSPVQDAGAEVILGSITDARLVEEAVEGVDAVCHLAALMPPTGNGEVFQVNVRGTFNVLEAVHTHGDHARVVHGSTDATYGTGLSERTYPDPIDETVPPEPTNFYGASKVIDEELLHQYRRLFGLDFVALRYFWIFDGAEVLDLFTMSMWAEFMSEEQVERFASSDAVPVLYEEDGKTPFTDHIVDARDVARATALAVSAPEATGERINIGGPGPFSYVDYSPLVAGRLGRPLEDVALPNFHAYSYDISKARAVLGFEPKHDIGDMLERAFRLVEGEGS
jgi:nucleoside-diphosphate-sugar epimerase